MTRSNAIGLLSNGSNGNEILSILNFIAENEYKKTFNEIAYRLFD
jgi:hypothetical protein